MAAHRKKHADHQGSQEQGKRGKPHVHRNVGLRPSSDIVKTGDRKRREERVTPIELFFDLVFVFAIRAGDEHPGQGV
jgi:hypothetical protein